MTLTLEQVERAASTRGWVIKSLGHVMVQRLDSRQLTRYETAKSVGFIESATPRSTTADYASNAFGYWCEAMGRPFVELRKARRYASVRFDLARGRLDDESVDAVLQEFNTVATSDSKASWGPITGDIDRVEVERARALAYWLVRFLHEHAREL